LGPTFIESAGLKREERGALSRDKKINLEKVPEKERTRRASGASSMGRRRKR